MISNRRLSELIHDVYAAAEDPERWPCFLEKLAEEIGSGMTVLLSVGWQDATASIATSARTDPELIRLYQGGWGAHDPWVASGHESLTREGAVNWSEELVPDRELVRTEFYNEFARRFEVFHAVTATVRSSPEMSAGLACHYGRSRKQPSRWQIGLVEMLVPHIAQALRLHERWRSERLAGTAAHQATEHSATGFAVVDGRGRLVRCNRVASDIFARGDGLRLRDGRVGCVHPSDDARLRTAMAAAAETALGSGTRAGGIVGVRRTALAPPYAIAVMPASGDGTLFTRHGGAAVLLIADPERSPRPDAAALQETYGWTPAETRIALSIADGLKPADIARRDGKSVGTVRGQLKTVFHKTGVSSQSELVRVILSSAIPRSHGDNGSV